VSNTTPSCHTISLHTNHHLGYHSRGSCYTTEPPSTFCSPDADRNRAIKAQISSFWAPALPPRVLECTYTPPPPPPRLHHPTTSPNLPPLPFPTPRPKLSPSGLVSSFWPKTRNPGLSSPTRDPTTAIILSSPPHHLPPSPTTTISNSAPQTEP
jgi:hypothetical protein